jgi:hypothetical protein
MIDSHRRRALLTFILALGALAAAPAGGAKNIPANVKSSAQLSAADVEVVKGFVAAQFGQLADPSPDKVKEARKALEEESKGSSPDYLNKYAAAVAETAVNVLKSDAPIRVKLLAAVVVGRVADTNGSPALAPAVVHLLGKDQPVVLQLWGMKAARGIMREAAKANKHAELIKVMVPVVKANPTGPITEEAYEALTLEDKNGDIKAAQPVLADGLIDLVNVRVGVYRTGPPEDPLVDYKPWNWFSTKAVWTGLAPAQQVKAVEAMCSVLTLGAKLIDDPKTPAAVREQLVTTVTRTAGNMYGLFAAPNPSDPLPVLLLQINKLDARTQNWTCVVAPVGPLIQKLPQYANMKPAAAAAAGGGGGQ